MALRDFRPQIQGPKSLTEGDLLVLCRRGEVARVISCLKQNGRDLADYRGLFDIGFRAMVRGRRFNEVLSILFKHQIRCEFQVVDLLRMMLIQGDVPGFLKQAWRFKVSEGLDSEIEQAISWMETKKQVGSANAFRRRFAALRAGETSEPRRS
jgi:hypothetical protein